MFKWFDVLTNEVNKLDQQLATGVFIRSLGRNCAKCFLLEPCLGKEKEVNKWAYKKNDFS